MSEAVDVREAVDAAPLSRGQMLTLAILGLVTLFDGYDTFTPGFVIPYAIRAWRLQPSEAGLLVSSGLVGFMIGSLSAGLVADRIGRKPTIVGGLVWAGLFDLAMAVFGRSFPAFLTFRLLTGLGLGMLLPLAVTLVNEMAPRRAVNLLVGWIMVGWSGGAAGAAAMAIALAGRFGWPSLFLIDGLAIPLAGLAALSLRESPRYLASADRQADVRRVMAWLIPTRAAAFAHVPFINREPPARRASLSQLLVPAVRRSTLIVWLAAALCLFTIFGLSTWAPLVLIRRGGGFASGFVFGIVLQLMAVVGGLVCGWAADRLDRKRVLITAWSLGAAAIAGLAFLGLGWTSVVCVSIAGFCIMGGQPLLNSLAASLYPTEIRSTGVGVELGIGRLGGILGPYAGGWLQQAFPGVAGLFLAMAVASGVAALALLGIRRPPKVQ